MDTISVYLDGSIWCVVWFFKVQILIGVFAGLTVYAYHYRKLANNIKVLKKLEKEYKELQEGIKNLLKEKA